MLKRFRPPRRAPHRRRRNVVLAFLLGAVVVVPGPGAAASPAPRQGAADEPLAPQEQRDLQFYGAILANSANDDITRTGAAERLLAMRSAAPLALLEEALSSGDASTMLAVIRAMNGLAAPPRGLLPTAVGALRIAPSAVLDELSIVIAKYDDEAVRPVVSLALDRDLPDAERLGPIHALGSFPTRESGDRLVELANPSRGEPESIRTAALTSLRRLAPADLGDDYRAWRRWWAGVRDKSQAEWARELVRQYQDRNAELERQTEDLARRYVELLGALYRSLDVTPDQLERLEADLEDSLGPVRQFAMERVSRLLRDSVVMPAAVRAKVAERLDDGTPSLRLQAALLLDELDEPGLGELIAARLPGETDAAVCAGYIDLLARRPTATALEPLLVRVPDAALGPAAAEALWQTLRAIELDPARVASACDEIRAALDGRVPDDAPPLGLVRLLALTGDETDLARLEPWLDAHDADLRAAVADGFAARGRRQPLLDRAGDPAIYPALLLALIEGPGELQDFQVLVGLEPPEGLQDEWADAVRLVAGRLPPEQLPEAERVLARIEHADPALRTMILLRAAVLPPDVLPLESRVDVVVRLTPMLIASGDALRAYEILEALNGSVVTPTVQAQRFRAALLAGRYDAAAQLSADPGEWIAVLDEFAAGGPTGVVRLRDEIGRRFPDLDPTLRTALGAASAKLPAADEAAATSGTNGDEENP